MIILSDLLGILEENGEVTFYGVKDIKFPKLTLNHLKLNKDKVPFLMSQKVKKFYEYIDCINRKYIQKINITLDCNCKQELTKESERL